MEKILAQGAEAIITLNNNHITKNRIKKSYRIPILDEKLRKSRTKSEAKIINKLSNIISVPKIIKTAALSDSKESELTSKQEISMEYIQGKKLSENLESLDYKEICKLIGENIALMHNQGIIHGDLTTSNMIYVSSSDSSSKSSALTQEDIPNKNLNINNINKITAKQASVRACEADNSKVYFIDFGLAFHSQKIEDKAVDIHLLQQALEAKHFTIYKECINIILENYEKTADKGKEIIHRIKVIESRGRYKDKY